MLIVELYVPGGISGAIGLIFILIGLILAAPDFFQGIKYVGTALIATIVAVPILFRLFGRMKTFDKIILSDTVVGGDKKKVNREYSSEWLGKTGTVISALRPSGSAQIDGEKVDVISDGEFLLPGTKIKVIKVEGLSVVVTRDE